MHEGGIKGVRAQYKTVNEAGGAQFSHCVDADGVAAAAFHKAEHSDGAYVTDLAMRHIRARHGVRSMCSMCSNRRLLVIPAACAYMSCSILSDRNSHLRRCFLLLFSCFSAGS